MTVSHRVASEEIGLVNAAANPFGLAQDGSSSSTNTNNVVQKRIGYRRDAEGKLLSQKLEIDNGQPSYQYLANYRYDPAGRLLQANNPHRELSWQYNPAGQVIKALQDQHELTHAYTPAGMRSSTRLPGGDEIRYGFNVAGQTESVHWNNELITGFVHDESGGEQARLFGNGLSQQNSFDPQGRLLEQTLSNHFGQQDRVINQRKYHYNATGQISQIDDQLRGSTQYHYDNIDRLVQVKGPQPEQFVHDPAGNLLGTKDEADTAAANSGNKTPQVSGNRLNFQGDRHFTYDAQGNRVEQRRGKDGKQITRYRYDHQNRLVGIEQENAASQNGKSLTRTEYQYDALGRRIRKIHTDTNQQITGGTEFYWNDDVLLTEQALDLTSDESSALESDRPSELQPTRHYVFEPNSFKPLAFVQHEEIHHYYLDHLGTPQEITNASGELVWTAQYKAYGSLALAPIRQVDNNLRFQGQYFDEESGLHYNRFRYYDPECGRFINQDPIGLLGGNNNYLYVPNPVAWVDPWGLSCSEDAIKLRANMLEQGLVEPHYSHAAHHIVQSNSTDEVSVMMREHLEKHGVDINSAENGVFLPTRSSVREAAGTDALPHSRMHSNAIRNTVKDRLMSLDSREELLDELDNIAEEMETGVFRPDRKYLKTSRQTDYWYGG